jgi:hypothetical protein
MAIFRVKPSLPNPEELSGILQLRWGVARWVWLDTYFTRLDQALALWGCVTAVIFWMGQLSSLAWRTQAIVDSILTLWAIALTLGLIWQWTRVKPFRWVVYFWSLLMLLGIGLTDLGIFRPVGGLLIHLCPIWLTLCGLGYGFTSLGMQSSALVLISLIHLCAIPLTLALPAWQFSLTGLVMSGSLWALATWQWDHL